MSAEQNRAADSPEQAQFRAHCRQWLAAHRPAKPSFRLPLTPIEVMTEPQLDYFRSWQRQCYDAGLIGCDYAAEYGGGGKSRFQRIANQEAAAARVPFWFNVIGLGMAAPTLLHHGSEELKRRFIPGILSGDDVWCQGFSEPGAGSDLASVQTSARRAGDRWVINGHKVWTSLAHFADWMILLARSGGEHKYRGLTYFVVPIKSALGHGVTVRPLIKMTGETGFNEVLFENLEVGDEFRLDEVGHGWNVAMTTLLHERGAGGLVTPSTGGTTVSSGSVEALIQLARTSQRNGQPAAQNPLVRDRIAQMAIYDEALQQLFRRARVPALCDHPMRIPMQGKLVQTEFMQAIAHAGMEIAGAASSFYLGDERAPDEGKWTHAYFNSYGMTIAAGTSEIQRNLLGERVLGLAKSK